MRISRRSDQAFVRFSGLLVAALLSAVLIVVLPPAAQAQGGSYLVGRGISDITGEAAETGMMGYASLDQATTGIHDRQRSRAFVVAEPDGGDRITFVEADLNMIQDSVRQAVLARLGQRYGSLYTESNVVLTANHTHAGPGGYAHYTLYNITTAGFHPRNFAAIVDGIVESIDRAHADLAPGTLALAQGELRNASVNRSRTAFERNPAADRAAFPDGIDPLTTVLRMDRGGEPVGMINWFAVHATSLTNTNTLISADNKGYAGYHWEREVSGGDYLAPGGPGFVAAFAQSNAGDMSPNLNLRPGSGPTEDERENTRILGTRQFDAAKALLDGGGTAMSGAVDHRFGYVGMGEGIEVRPEFTGDGRTHRTCAGALGASFAAGSVEDGPGPPIFNEGAGNNPVLGVISAALYTASPALRACQAPKDILLPTGTLGFTQQTMPIGLVRIGELYLVTGGHEFTITAGLRVRRTVAGVLGVPVQNVIMSGYTNSYAGYITTPEEYDAQEYEGGHTLFGRWSLPAYQQEFARLAEDMKAGRPTVRGTPSPDLSRSYLPGLAPGVVLDAPQTGRRFGDVLTEPTAAYTAGQQVVAEFAGAHPNNDVRRGGTFLQVQRLDGNVWQRVHDDGDWSTTFRWAREGLAASRVRIEWDVPPGTPPGSYRIVYTGDARSLFGTIRPITGTTRSFQVT